MFILFPLSTVIFVVALIILFFASVFNSALQIYSWLESHLILVITILLIRALISIFSYIIGTKKKNKEITVARMSVEIISNIFFIVAFCLFIHDMAGLSSEHPIVTGICSFLSIYTVGYSLILSFNFNEHLNSDADYMSSVLLMIVSVFIIVVSIISDSDWLIKILLNAIFAFLATAGYDIIHDIF